MIIHFLIICQYPYMLTVILLHYPRALDKREYLMISFVISQKSYVVTSHLNCLVETVQMRDHNKYLHAEFTKIIPNYHQILPLV